MKLRVLDKDRASYTDKELLNRCPYTTENVALYTRRQITARRTTKAAAGSTRMEHRHRLCLVRTFLVVQLMSIKRRDSSQ